MRVESFRVGALLLVDVEWPLRVLVALGPCVLAAFECLVS